MFVARVPAPLEFVVALFFLSSEAECEKARLTSVRPLGLCGVGGVLVLYAACQRLNDGSQSTPAQLRLHSVNVHAVSHVGMCVVIQPNVPLCVFLRSRVNYIGLDVKGGALVSKIRLPSAVTMETALLILDSFATVIDVIYIDLVSL